MIKTQIQLPDELYRELQQLASAREWSLAETLRRAVEQFLSTHPTGVEAAPWQLPAAKHCGEFLAGPEKWTDLAHED